MTSAQGNHVATASRGEVIAESSRNDAATANGSQNRGQPTVTLQELFTVAIKHGLPVTLDLIHVAVARRELEPAGHHPLRFQEAEANRWLNEVARSTVWR